MQRKLVGSIAAAMVMLAAIAAQGEEWQWPNLNPFSSSKPSNLAKRESNNSSWWPSLPTMGKPSPRRGPTTWQRIQAAPGNVMNKTKETLSPLNPFQEEPKRSGMSGSSKKKQAESSWWPKWMTAEEEKGPPLTITDWLSNPRPE
jgi:hypothetical protein